MKKILIIDDEIALLEVFKSLLISLECHVDVASSKKDALTLFDNEYNKVFIDYYLYDENAYDLIELACKKYGCKNICIISGISDKKIIKKLNKIGIEKMLKKPILATQFNDFINGK